jgi:hypothetical protein
MMNSPMTTDKQLLKMAQKFDIPLRNICFKDALNDDQPENGCYIINLADSDENGTHWVCLSIENDGCSYFDSFGFPPPNEVIEFCKRRGDKKILINAEPIQNMASGYCGQYCINFLTYMTHLKGTGRTSSPFKTPNSFKKYAAFLKQFT